MKPDDAQRVLVEMVLQNEAAIREAAALLVIRGDMRGNDLVRLLDVAARAGRR